MRPPRVNSFSQNRVQLDVTAFTQYI